MPTVAPKIPRETSVGFAGAPVLVLILVLELDTRFGDEREWEDTNHSRHRHQCRILPRPV